MSLSQLLLATLLLAVAIPSASAQQWWFGGGAALDPAGLQTWQEVTAAPTGSLDSPGPRLALFLTQNGGDGSARFEGGFAFARPEVSGDVMGGFEARRHDARTALSPVVAAALETAGARGGVAAMAMLRPAFGEAWLEVRPWLDLGQCRKLGALLAGAPGPDDDGGFRAGIFGSGYRLVLPLIRDVFIGAELGLAGHRRSPALSPFASLSLGFDL